MQTPEGAQWAPRAINITLKPIGNQIERDGQMRDRWLQRKVGRVRVEERGWEMQREVGRGRERQRKVGRCRERQKEVGRGREVERGRERQRKVGRCRERQKEVGEVERQKEVERGKEKYSFTQSRIVHYSMISCHNVCSKFLEQINHIVMIIHFLHNN